MTKTAKWVLLVLGVSLSINLFGLGIYVGGKLQPPPPDLRPDPFDRQTKVEFKRQREHEQKRRRVKERRAPRDGRPAITVRRLMAAVPRDKHPAMEAALEASRSKVRAALVGQRQAQNQLYEVLVAEPLDLEALKKALEQEQVYKNKLDSYSRDLILAILPSLDQQDRLTFGKSVITQRVRRFKKKGDR